MAERKAEQSKVSENSFEDLADALRELDTSFLPISPSHPDKINYGSGFYYDRQEDTMIYCKACARNGNRSNKR